MIINRNMQRTRSIVLVVATCLLCLERSIICDVVEENSKSAGNVRVPNKSPNGEPTVVDVSTSDVAKSRNNDQKQRIKNDGDDKTSSVGTIAETKTNSSEGILTSKSKSAVVGTKNGADDTATGSKLPEPPVIGHAASLNTGAVLRGFYVFVGLSVLALGYIVYRSFGVNKPRTQMVRKYGVLAHKQDIEMRPLPLDEDDEDDTIVFDASGLSPSRS